MQASQAMRPDYAQISTILLLELVTIQRASSSGAQPSFPPSLPFSSPSEFVASPSQSDIWVNALWFTSLSLSLMCAIFAIVSKQWLHHFMSVVSAGTPQERTRIRHFRFTGLEMWHVPALIECLPVVMNIAVALFLIGLVIFLSAMSFPISATVTFFAASMFGLYISSIILPLIYIHCPYKSPMTTYIHHLYTKVIYPWLSWFFDTAPLSFEDLEQQAVKNDEDRFDVKALVWLYETSPNSTVKGIILQAISGLHSHHRCHMLPIGGVLRRDVRTSIQSCLEHDIVIPSMESKLEHLLRALYLVEDFGFTSKSGVTGHWRPIDSSSITNPQLHILHTMLSAGKLGLEQRLELILDYASGSKKDVFQHPLVWEQLFDVDLPTPDQLNLRVVTEILSQLTKTAFLPSDTNTGPNMLPLPSAATISDLIQTRPDQGYCYLNRLLQLKEITSDTITMEGYIDLFKSMLSWVLRAPMSVIQLAEWQDLLKEITRYLEMFFHSYGTSEVLFQSLRTSILMSALWDGTHVKESSSCWITVSSQTWNTLLHST